MQFNKGALFQKIVTLLLASVAILLTTISPIFTNFPTWVTGNKIGYFIVGVAFGPIASLIYVVAVQGVFVLFHLSEGIFSYSMLVNLLTCLAVSLLTLNKERLPLKIAISAIFAAFIARPVAMLISAWIAGNPVDFSLLFHPSILMEQGKLYLLTAGVTMVFYLLLERVNRYIVERRKL